MSNKNINKRRTNVYDLFLFLMIMSLSFGQIGGSVQLSRICFVLLIPPMLFNIRNYRKTTDKVLIIFLLFFFFCISSLVWTSNIELGAKEIIYFFVIFMSILEFLVFWKKSSDPISTISKAWLYSFLFTGIIALWEIKTGHHLPVAYLEEKTLRNGVDAALNLQFASATFGNYNSYVVFICFSLPFIIYSLVSYGKVTTIIGIISLLICTMVLFSNASRGGLIAFAIIVLSSLWLLLSKKRFGYLILLLTLSVVLLIVYSMRDMLLANILYRISNGGMFEDTGRSEIWLTAISLGLSTLCIGTGVGSLSTSMSGLRHGDNPMAHNLFLEIFVQYGLFFLIIFVCFIFGIFRKSLKSIDYKIKSICLSACLAMPFIFIINSSYLTMSSLWLFLLSLYVFVNESENQTRRNVKC